MRRFARAQLLLALLSVQLTLAQGIDLSRPGQTRRWIDSSSETRPLRMQQLFEALEQDLAHRLEPTNPAFLEALFGSAAPPEAWQAASFFAERSDLKAAAWIGEAALPGLAPEARGPAALRLAGWQLLIGDRERAINALEIARKLPSPGFAQPWADALRSEWLLADATEREALRVAIARNPAAQSLVGALEGEPIGPLVQKTLQGWLAESRLTPQIIHSSVLQAVAWHLPSLATALVSAAGSLDPAALALQEKLRIDWGSEMPWLRALAGLATSPPREAVFHARGLPQTADSQRFLQLVRELDALGLHPAAQAVREEALARMPEDPFLIEQAIVGARETGDLALAADRLEAWLQSPHFPRNFQYRAQNALELAALRDRLGQPAAALPALDAALELAPADHRLTAARDRVLQDLQRTSERLSLHRSLAEANPAAHSLACARLLVRCGKFENARSIDHLTPEQHRLVEFDIAVANASPSREVAVIEKMGQHEEWSALCELAPLVVDPAPQSALARELRRGLYRAGDRATRFRCGFTLARMQPRTVAALAPILAETSRYADAENDRRGTFQRQRYLLCKDDPALRAWLRAQLEDEPDGCLQQIDLALPDASAATLTRLLDECLVSERLDVNAWLRIARQLASQDHHALAANVLRKLHPRHVENLEITISLATALAKSGRGAEARETIRPLVLLSRIDTGHALQLADYYITIDRPNRAQTLLAEAAAADRAVTLPDVWTSLARLAVRQGDPSQAKLWLETAFQNTTNSDWDAIAEWLIARPDFSSVDPATPQLDLSPRRWLRARAAVARRLLAAHQPTTALAWLPAPLLVEPEVASMLEDLGKDRTNWPQVAGLWEQAAAHFPDSPVIRAARANFALTLTRDSSSENAIDVLTGAPRTLATALALAEALRADGRPADALETLESAATLELPPPARGLLRRARTQLTEKPDLPLPLDAA